MRRDRFKAPNVLPKCEGRSLALRQRYLRRSRYKIAAAASLQKRALSAPANSRGAKSGRYIITPYDLLHDHCCCCRVLLPHTPLVRSLRALSLTFFCSAAGMKSRRAQRSATRCGRERTETWRKQRRQRATPARQQQLGALPRRHSARAKVSGRPRSDG